MAKSPDDVMSAVIGSLADRTGRPLEEWLALVDASGIDPLDQNAVRRWLRSEHGVAQNSQWPSPTRPRAPRLRPERVNQTADTALPSGGPDGGALAAQALAGVP